MSTWRLLIKPAARRRFTDSNIMFIRENAMHRNTVIVGSILALAMQSQAAYAERPQQTRDDATHVVTGVIKQIEKKDAKSGNDGVKTYYTAEIVIDEVGKGEGLKANDTLKFSWFRVTKRPSAPLPGTYGQSHASATQDARVRVWLMKGDASKYDVIYNSNGMEPAKK
jgi:hypothetical protein